MSAIQEFLQQYFKLSSRATAILQPLMKEKQYHKGEILIRAGEVHRAVYFIYQGAMRSFYINEDGKDITHWLGFEGDIVASLGSFVAAKPSLEDMEFLEDSTVLKIDKEALIDLFEKDLELANFGRRLAEKALLEMEEQIILTQFTDAKNRYLQLIENHPHILQRVKLGHISSYLGITQVTLSRIRADI